MKKFLKIAAVSAFALVLASCGKAGGNDEQLALTKIKVGATPSPHAEILEQSKDILTEKGYELEIVEYNDYIQPNIALNLGELDANYFQHLPYLENFNEENGTDLISIGKIHYEPFGIYAGKTESLEELKDGAVITVPNDPTNEARALLLLEKAGLITLRENIGLDVTVLDITDNPKNLLIQEIEAAQLARTLQDVDLAVINGNYALQAGLDVNSALDKEDAESIGADTFANVLVVKEGEENREELKALLESVMSEAAKTYMEETYNGAVVPLF